MCGHLLQQPQKRNISIPPGHQLQRGQPAPFLGFSPAPPPLPHLGSLSRCFLEVENSFPKVSETEATRNATPIAPNALPLSSESRRPWKAPISRRSSGPYLRGKVIPSGLEREWPEGGFPCTASQRFKAPTSRPRDCAGLKGGDSRPDFSLSQCCLQGKSEEGGSQVFFFVLFSVLKLAAFLI